jgi:hypothetical protein
MLPTPSRALGAPLISLIRFQGNAWPWTGRSTSFLAPVIFSLPAREILVNRHATLGVSTPEGWPGTHNNFSPVCYNRCRSLASPGRLKNVQLGNSLGIQTVDPYRVPAYHPVKTSRKRRGRRWGGAVFPALLSDKSAVSSNNSVGNGHFSHPGGVGLGHADLHGLIHGSARLPAQARGGRGRVRGGNIRVGTWSRSSGSPGRPHKTMFFPCCTAIVDQ